MQFRCLKHASCLFGSTKKVGFSKWRTFFDLMHFRPWPLPSGGFLKKPADKVLIFLLKTTYFIIKILNLHHYFTPNFFLVDMDYFDTVIVLVHPTPKLALFELNSSSYH